MASQGQCDPSLDYRNIGPTAAWPLTSITHSMYERLDHDSLSPWRVMPGFHFKQISHDWMHHVYLGTARDLCGSGFFGFEFGVFLFDDSQTIPKNMPQQKVKLRFRL